MDADALARVQAHFAALENQPFGNVESVSGRTLQPFSLAGQRAAGNLLAKALRALGAGDESKAGAYVDRAARLPFDPHEQMFPAAGEGTMALFSLVVDALEECEEDDVSWLEAARHAAASADEVGKCELRHTLQAIEADYQLTRRERAALRRLRDSLPEGMELRDRRGDPDELADLIMSVLAVCRDYQTAFDAAG